MIFGTNKKIFSDSVILAYPAQLFSININIYLRDNKCQGLSREMRFAIHSTVFTNPERTHSPLPSVDPAVNDVIRTEVDIEYCATSRYIDLKSMTVTRVVRTPYIFDRTLHFLQLRALFFIPSIAT